MNPQRNSSKRDYNCDRAGAGENLPTTAQALQTLPDALGRFGGLVEAFDANLDNYETIKPVAFSPIIWPLFWAGW